MSELMQAVLNSEEKNDLRSFMYELRLSDKRYLLRNDILNVFGEFCTKHKQSTQGKSIATGTLQKYR